MADLVEDVSTASGRGDSGSFPVKFGGDSPPATKSVAADVSMIDDDLENELLAKLDMLADPAVKSESVADKGKSVMEEEPKADAPTQEQISVAILTLQELIDSDPSHFCQVSKQQAALKWL
ncbi:hypothetical protein SLA2020_234050 [Shorea laevis]